MSICFLCRVGSHAAQMLVRAGVGKVRLVDFDQVSLSSLNRHAVATRADVGLSKAKVLRSRLAAVAPFVTIEAVTTLFDNDSAPDLLAGVRVFHVVSM
jgi:tRNA threonylcarbamoyladenosine dehydratase